MPAVPVALVLPARAVRQSSVNETAFATVRTGETLLTGSGGDPATRFFRAFALTTLLTVVR